MTLLVDAQAGMLQAFARSMPCSIGRSGLVPDAEKQEGDGASPIGTWPIRGALLRPDRVAWLAVPIPWRWLRDDDGWSDDPGDPAYNRPVRHPHPFSAERLWRADGLYDIIVVLGHNDRQPRRGGGSAIFLHCRNPGHATEGCIAVDREALAGLLPLLRLGMMLEIG